MTRLARLLRSLHKIVVLSFLVPLLRLIFGDIRWSPPGWLRRSADHGRRGVARTAAAVAKHRTERPRAFWLTVSTAVTLMIVGVETYRYYANLPKPYTLRVTVSAPVATPFKPDAKPASLFVAFSGSAAPLGMSGKPVASGIALEPPIAGEWRWNSDSALVFKPTDHWPLGQTYRLTLQPSVVASHVLLESYVHELSAPGVTAELKKSEFYQDPTTPSIRKVVATIAFSHPIEKAELEKRISLKMRVIPVKSFDEEGARSLGFTVSYNELGTEAYVHSEQLAVPPEDAHVLIRLSEGSRSSMAGPARVGKLERSVYVPGIEKYFHIASFSTTAVENQRGEMERVGTIETSAAADEQGLRDKVEVYLLPKDKPRIGDEDEQEDYQWTSAEEAVPQVLERSDKVAIEWIPNETPVGTAHAFKFLAPPGRFVLVRVGKGAKSADGYELVRDWGDVVLAEEFPRSLKIMSQGSLLSLGGEKKLGLVARNVPAVRVELARLLPETINHLVSITDGTFDKPSFAAYRFSLENIAERFEDVLMMPPAEPGKNQYSFVDLGRFLRAEGAPRGLFYLKLRGHDPEKAKRDAEAAKRRAEAETESEDEYSSGDGPSEDSEETSTDGPTLETVGDERLVLITDLGIVTKDSVSGAQEVFVTSFRARGPVAGATVMLLGKNGVPIFTGTTNEEGSVSFPSAKEFVREKQPTAFIASLNGDLTFLPYGRSDRRLDFTRFDTGGLYNSEQIEGLQAYVFSDRGIYRPGDEARIGMVVKARDWALLTDGLPLELVVTDPRGVAVRRQTLRFRSAGFEEYHFPTRDDSATGTYQFALHVVKDGKQKGLLGTTSIRVEDFQPDLMTVRAAFSAAAGDGWVKPDELTASVTVRNLFGTAAAERKVKASMMLAPWSPYFGRYPGYEFHDPFTARRSVTDELGEGSTDSEGVVEFKLDLNRFEPKTYRVTFAAEAFERDSGRSVVNTIASVVSPAEFLLGFKTDGDLGYVQRGAERNVSVVAIDRKLDPVAVSELTSEVIEHRYVSVLTKQEDGTFAYQSVLKHLSKGSQPFSLPAGGAVLPLDTSAPGSFTLYFKDAKGTELTSVSYEVIGEANVAGDLERNAELKLRLNKKSYEPGEEIELEVEAPYTGHGLITIERDRVFTRRWFVADSTSTVQRITVPEDLEGNGYLTVTFVRALDSAEVFMSPLSYGSVPFNVGRKRRTHDISIDAPERARPGEILQVGYRTERPAKLVLYAIDEGILQVARYRTPDPLSHFFRKRALEVRTSQILDLLLPEFEILKSRAAPGGDEDAELGKYHNPFKRKNQAPMAFWSGIVESGPELKFIGVPVPDHFNGSVRIMAVAVSDLAVGVAEKRSIVRGDFVIQPQSPLFVAPGDEFEIGALVANELAGSGPNAKLTVSLESSEHLEFPQGMSQEIDVPEGKDRSVRFLARAKPTLGAARMRLKVAANGREAGYALEMSVRPPQPFMTSLATSYGKSGLVSGNKRELPLTRDLYPEMRVVEASASMLPLGLADGLVQYLKNYPYGCTEQITSQAMPGLILGARPEFHATKADLQRFVDRAFATLQSRQRASGGFGMWSGGDNPHEYYTAYATHFLIEAKERGLDVPAGLLERAIEYLKSEVRRHESETSPPARAYALYVLSRSGVLVANDLGSFTDWLEKEDRDGTWMQSSIGLFLAGAYRIATLNDSATEIFREIDPSMRAPGRYRLYAADDVSLRALYFYILAKHFPERVSKLSGEEILGVAQAIGETMPTSISSSYAILGLDAYARVVTAPSIKPIRIAEVLKDGTTRALELPPSLIVRAPVSPDAVRVRFEGDTAQPLFYQLSEAGFDRVLPNEPISKSFEILHELVDDKGQPIKEIALDEKLYVRVSLRGFSHVASAAVVDLFPGGFEVDITPEGLGQRRSLESGPDAWQPEYIDVREDRVIFYGDIPQSTRKFVYRLKPTNKGTYAVPPAYGEAMYSRSQQARSVGGRISIVE